MVTADSTVCALAPMYTLLTVTWGGARLGNCAMGRVGMEIAPPKMISSAQTVANTGRRMKKSTKFSSAVAQALFLGPRLFIIPAIRLVLLAVIANYFALVCCGCSITGIPSCKNCNPEV